MLSKFVTIPVKRGITEIRPILELISGLDAFICGGYVRYCASPLVDPVEAGDVDIYCKTVEVFDRIKKQLADWGVNIRYENHISVTYAKPQEGLFHFCPTVQLIKPITEGAIVASGTMEEILDNFDFSIVRCGLISSTEALVDEDFEANEKTKILRLRNIHCPISSTLRCMKYSRKGYFLRPSEALKLFLDWDNRTPGYRQKLIEGLMASAKGQELTREEIDELEALLRID